MQSFLPDIILLQKHNTKASPLLAAYFKEFFRHTTSAEPIVERNSRASNILFNVLRPRSTWKTTNCGVFVKRPSQYRSLWYLCTLSLWNDIFLRCIARRWTEPQIHQSYSSRYAYTTIMKGCWQIDMRKRLWFDIAHESTKRTTGVGISGSNFSRAFQWAYVL